MKKFLFSALILVFLIGAGTGPVAAADFPKDAQILPSSFLNIYWIDKAFCMGLKQRLFTPVYATANLDFDSASTDLTLSLGLAYVLPKEEWLFQIIPINLYFYAGGGWQYTRNQGQQNSYLLIGANFLFLFTESVYPLGHEVKPQFRSGFSIKF
ncbi:MAG TPA: hypothetical protein GXZ98_08215 [Firmicutes bacterium]|jgi:hypothetical protein|nr:hypothetical protein [Bacillota bacterium]